MNNRRQTVRRLLINPPVFVSFGAFKTAILFDICESGLSVYGYNACSDLRNIRTEFRLPRAGESISAVGEVAWSSKSRNLTGIHFSEISPESLLRLRAWLATGLPPAAPYALVYNPPTMISRCIRTLSEKSKAFARLIRLENGLIDEPRHSNHRRV